MSGEVILHAENSVSHRAVQASPWILPWAHSALPDPLAGGEGLLPLSKHSTPAVGSCPMENPGHSLVKRWLLGWRRSWKITSLPLWNGCPFEARMRRAYSHNTVIKSDTLQPTFWPIKTLIISLCSKTIHFCPQIPQAFKSVNHTSINANIVLHGAYKISKLELRFVSDSWVSCDYFPFVVYQKEHRFPKFVKFLFKIYKFA